MVKNFVFYDMLLRLRNARNLNGIRPKVIEMLIPIILISNLGGYLSGKGRVSLLNVDCTLEGEFVNGKLHGPVRGLTTKGTKV